MGKAPLTAQLTDRIGPFKTATVLIADRLDDATPFVSSGGRYCLIETLDSPLQFRRIITDRENEQSGLIALVPYATTRTVDHDFRIAWTSGSPGLLQS